MILIYARVARQAAQDGKPLAATGWFAGGYLLSWTAFSLIAAIAQGLLERAAWLTPMMAAASNRIGGVVLIAAGLYQFTPLKNSCLIAMSVAVCVHSGAWRIQGGASQLHPVSDCAMASTALAAAGR